MSSDYFYEGADYGFDPEHGSFSKIYSGDLSRNIGLATDVRMANQLKAVSEKLNTGATAVEVSTISSDVFESIPKEHFRELDRLRKLVGKNVELTLHAPLVEPTGMTQRGEWDAYRREESERQMIDAVKKAHDLNREGNVVTTFHASLVGAPAETVVWEGREGEKKRVVKEAFVIDQSTGRPAQIPLKPEYLEMKEGEQITVENKIKEYNNEEWNSQLQQINYHAENGSNEIKGGMTILDVGKEGKKELIEEKGILGLYKYYIEGKSGRYEKLKEINPTAMNEINDKMQIMTRGDIHLRSAYDGLRKLYDQAYSALKDSNDKEGLNKLDDFRKKIQKTKIDYLKDPEHLDEFSNIIKEGVYVLRSMEATQIPQRMKPLKDFALDKSSETFSNVALASFKEFGEHSPVLSIENPPAGTAIISSGEDLRKLIDESREKFKQKAMRELGLSESKAKEEAEKLIGATWDLGHINMIRKFGAGAKEIEKETRAIAPVLKHIHLSDNFGLEHTELPMGMGNVLKESTFKIFKEQTKNLDKIKKVIEAGQWYQHFQTTPFRESLEAFGSPLYSSAALSQERGSYFSGYGMNPEIHHSMYGTGFANLPVELGGQMTGRSRVSGAPME